MNHSTIDRRRFLQLAAAMPMLLLSPSVFSQTSKKKPILLLVELKGGNDALNTLIPYEDDNYYRLRPSIGIQAKDVLKLGNGLGMNPAMQALLPEWQAGDLAWIQGIGYPDPNRSHFRSIEIWETASHSDQYLNDGWLAQLLGNEGNKKTKDLNGVIIGSDSGPLAGRSFNSLLMQNKDSFMALTKRLKAVEKSTQNDALAHVLSVKNNIKSNAQTHQNQLKRQASLLKQLSEGLAAFSAVMKKVGLWDDVLIVTYSEFGRRVNENKSGGTDHGTAAAHLALGGRVKGGINKGLIGLTPSLSNLDNNDLKYTTDFRTYYNTIASDWLGVQSPWSNFGQLPLIET